MSQFPERQVLPFLTRDMLAFEHGSTFTLRITTQATEVGPVTIRGFTREGPFAYVTNTINNASPLSADFRIPDIPIMVSVLGTGTEFVQGQVYATLSLLVNGDRIYELCSGLVTLYSGISYPAQVTSDQVPNHGNFRIVEGADPGAGAECSITCPTGVLWRVLGFGVTFTTAVAAANRRVHLVLTIGGLYQPNIFAATDHLASLARQYTFARFGALPSETNDNDLLVQLPDDLWMTPTDTIATQTLNIQAADNFDTPRLHIEEWPRSTA